MQQRTLKCEGRVCNWQVLYASAHWTVRNKLAHDFHALVRAAIDPEQEPFVRQVDILVQAFSRSQPPDPDNVCAKVYIDGLKGWWIGEDTPTWVRQVTTQSTKGPEDCVLITVTEVEGAPILPWDDKYSPSEDTEV